MIKDTQQSPLHCGQEQLKSQCKYCQSFHSFALTAHESPCLLCCAHLFTCLDPSALQILPLSSLAPKINEGAFKALHSPHQTPLFPNKKKKASKSPHPRHQIPIVPKINEGGLCVVCFFRKRKALESEDHCRANFFPGRFRRRLNSR